jgi:hypothetical protein
MWSAGLPGAVVPLWQLAHEPVACEWSKWMDVQFDVT